MSQAEQLLSGMQTTKSARLVNPDTEPHIVIDDNRFITVPEELKRIAVQHDHNIETVTFDCPRFWDDHDLSQMRIYINYLLPDKVTKGSYIATDITVDEYDETLMHFKWRISREVTTYDGKLSFLVAAKRTDDDGNKTHHWSSELCRDVTISGGLECVEPVEELYPDIITDLLTRMENIESTAGAEGIDEIYNRLNNQETITETLDEDITGLEGRVTEVEKTLESGIGSEELIALENRIDELQENSHEPMFRTVDTIGHSWFYDVIPGSAPMGLNLYGSSTIDSVAGNQLFDRDAMSISPFEGTDPNITKMNNGEFYAYGAYSNNVGHERVITISPNSLLKENTRYLIVVEIVSLTQCSIVIGNHEDSETCQFLGDQNIELSSDTPSFTKIFGELTTRDSFDNCTSMGTILIKYEAAAGMKYAAMRLSILEDTSITADTFKYEPFTGGIPGPNLLYPIDIRRMYETEGGYTNNYTIGLGNKVSVKLPSTVPGLRGISGSYNRPDDYTRQEGYTDVLGVTWWWADELDYERGVLIERVKTVIFDGSDDEEIIKVRSNDDNSWLYMIKLPVRSSSNGICNRISRGSIPSIDAVTWDESNALENVFINAALSNTHAYFNIGYYMEVNTVEEVRRLLSLYPIEYDYPMEESVESPIDDALLDTYRKVRFNRCYSDYDSDKGRTIYRDQFSTSGYSRLTYPITETGAVIAASNRELDGINVPDTSGLETSVAEHEVILTDHEIRISELEPTPDAYLVDPNGTTWDDIFLLPDGTTQPTTKYACSGVAIYTPWSSGTAVKIYIDGSYFGTNAINAGIIFSGKIECGKKYKTLKVKYVILNPSASVNLSGVCLGSKLPESVEQADDQPYLCPEYFKIAHMEEVSTLISAGTFKDDPDHAEWRWLEVDISDLDYFYLNFFTNEILLINEVVLEGSDLETTVSGLNNRLTTSEATIVDHETRITEIEENGTGSGYNTTVINGTISADSIYSLEERIIGTWIDGKPLYQKTITNLTVVNTSSELLTFKHGIENVETIRINNTMSYIIASGWSTFNQITTTVPINYPSTSNVINSWVSAVNDTYIYLQTGLDRSGLIPDIIITLEYTKTTDEAATINPSTLDERVAANEADISELDARVTEIEENSVSGGSPEISGTLKPWLYDTDNEVVIGVYDGKPLYRKVVSAGALPNTTTKSVAIGIENIETITSLRGISYNPTSLTWFMLPNTSASEIKYQVGLTVDGDNFTIITGVDRSGFTETHIFIEYTKTTDATGSGNGLMPYGNYINNQSNNYSLEEQVIGTWTDGKPLYQKTVYMGNLPNSNHLMVDPEISNREKFIKMEGYAINPLTGANIPLPYHEHEINRSIYIGMVTATGHLFIKTNCGDYTGFTESYLTVRYTKTTD